MGHACRDACRRDGAPSGQEDSEWSPSGSAGLQGSPGAELQPEPSAGRSRPPGRSPAGPPSTIADSSDDEGSAQAPGRRLALGPHVISDSPDDEGCARAASKRARQAGGPDGSAAGSSSRMLTAPGSLRGLQGAAADEADLQARASAPPAQPLQAPVHAAQAPPAMRLAELRQRAHAAGSGAGPSICARVHGHIQTLLGGLVFRDEEGRPASQYFLELTVADDGGEEADAVVSSALLHSLLGALLDSDA